MKFAFSEVSATQFISQRFATFCNVIATFAVIFLIFAMLLQLLQHYFLFLATFLHCSYWQNSLSLRIFRNFIAFIMQSFTIQFITWFYLRYSGVHNYRVLSVKNITFKSTVVLIITKSPVISYY